MAVWKRSCSHFVREAANIRWPRNTTRVINSSSPIPRWCATEDIHRVLRALIDLLDDPAQQGLRQSFTLWIKGLLRRKTPATPQDLDRITDLMEVDTMLAETIERWFAEERNKGLQQGLQEGLEQGLRQGLQQGEAASLKRLLERRFGPLSEAIASRIAQASLAEIEPWFDRAIDAPDLHSVFDSRDQPPADL